MKLLSLFDGSGAFVLAAEKFGITGRYASEVEPFPIAVTRKRFPNMTHLGDVTKISGAEIEPCEVVTCGFPCTDISIAGKGGGLAMARSGLFYEAIRVIREMLEATEKKFPRYLLFENVPNLLSINGGADWKIVMDCIADLGFIADPNILDSQEFGIAQRRKRVFIACINHKYYDPTDFFGIPCNRDKRMVKAVKAWGGETFCGITSRPHETTRQHLSEILEKDVDPKYYLTVAACLGILRRVDAKGKEIPQLLRSALEYQARIFCTENAENSEVCSFEPGATKRLPNGKYWNGIAPCLRSEPGDNLTAVCYENHSNDSRYVECGDVFPVITKRFGDGGNNQHLVLENPVAYGISSVSSNSMNSQNPHSGVYETDMAKTLDTSSQAPKNQGALVVCIQGSMENRSIEHGPVGKGVQENLSYTLNTGDKHSVAYSMTTGSYPQVNENKVATLTARDFKDAPLASFPAYVIDRAAYNQGANALYKPQIEEESIHSLTARGPGAVAAPPSYVVRRLTPRECLVLMNLPPDHCDNLGIENPTEDDYNFWTDVFATLGKKKSRKQIATFLRKPYSDSACYKMAGNGAVTAVCEWVIQGFAEHYNK